MSEEEAIAVFDPKADNEAIYDNEVQPLMLRIAEICRAKGICFIATFNYAPHSFATTSSVISGCSGLLGKLVEVLFPDRKVKYGADKSTPREGSN